MKNELNKLLENRIYNHKECVSKIEELADKQTTEFAKWLENLTEAFYLKNQEASYSELLDIFKRELSETVA